MPKWKTSGMTQSTEHIVVGSEVVACVGCGDPVITKSGAPLLMFGSYEGQEWRLFAAYHNIDCFHLAHPTPS